MAQQAAFIAFGTLEKLTCTDIVSSTLVTFCVTKSTVRNAEKVVRLEIPLGFCSDDRYVKFKKKALKGYVVKFYFFNKKSLKFVPDYLDNFHLEKNLNFSFKWSEI